MNGTLDRLIEERLCALIAPQLPIYAQAQCVPFLRGEGESKATLPRIGIKAESQDTPELYTIGVYSVNVEAESIVAGTEKEQARQLDGMNRAIDSILGAEGLPALLSTSRLQVYGAVIGGEAQEMGDNRLTRRRSIVIHARIR